MNLALAMTQPPLVRSDFHEVVAGEDRFYLHPGHVAAASTPVVFTTILGSCVTICLHDPIARVAGINHYLLPKAPEGDSSARYGDVAFPLLLGELRIRGAKAPRLRAIVIGGACVLHSLRHAPLGRQNVQLALEMLRDARISVVHTDVEGERGRRVFFNSQTGQVVVKTL